MEGGILLDAVALQKKSQLLIFTVFAFTVQELDRKKAVSSWDLQGTVGSSINSFALTFPLTPQWASSFIFPPIVFVCFLGVFAAVCGFVLLGFYFGRFCLYVFSTGSRGKKPMLSFLLVSPFSYYSCFANLEWKLDHSSLKHLQTDWIPCNILGWCLL